LNKTLKKEKEHVILSYYEKQKKQETNE